MKIDPNVQLNTDPQSDAVANTKKGAERASSAQASNSPKSSSEDSFQVSGRHSEVQQLTAQVASLPDVRASRVAPLKAAVQQKTYQPDSGKIADAMLTEQSSRTAKA